MTADLWCDHSHLNPSVTSSSLFCISTPSEEKGHAAWLGVTLLKTELFSFTAFWNDLTEKELLPQRWPASFQEHKANASRSAAWPCFHESRIEFIHVSTLWTAETTWKVPSDIQITCNLHVSSFGLFPLLRVISWAPQPSGSSITAAFFCLLKQRQFYEFFMKNICSPAHLLNRY